MEREREREKGKKKYNVGVFSQTLSSNLIRVKIKEKPSRLSARGLPLIYLRAQVIITHIPFLPRLLFLVDVSLKPVLLFPNSIPFPSCLFVAITFKCSPPLLYYLPALSSSCSVSFSSSVSQIFLSFNNSKQFFCCLIQLNSLKFHSPLWRANNTPHCVFCKS